LSVKRTTPFLHGTSKMPPETETALPADYSKADNWLAAPAQTAPAKPVDVFFVYPTAWRARPGQSPLSTLDDPAMREGARYYLATRASVFETCAAIFAPYYRQLDSAFAVAMGKGALRYFHGVPLGDVTAAFDHYITCFNRGKPFLLAGHSQGSIMLAGILCNYMPAHPDVYRRMIAAYAIGIPLTRKNYADHPHLKAATGRDDLGVIISYNTEAPSVAGLNPFSTPEAVTINPVSWTTSDAVAPADESLGSMIVLPDKTMRKVERFADARICPERGTIVCSTVDPARFSSSGASSTYFPRGVLHRNDIPLYYFDLRANAELRARKYLTQERKQPGFPDAFR
jgi:hypothetical protein